jgi:hypothetical protein
MTAATAELEGLKAELVKARQEAEQQKAAATKAEGDLAAKKVARDKFQARVLEVEETLKGVYQESVTRQNKEKVANMELEKLRLVHAKVQTQAQADREVLQQEKQIATGKPFLLQCVFGHKAFADLLRSAANAGRYYSTREGHAAERAFWQQFQTPSHLELLNHRKKQLMELFRMVKPTLQDLRVNLWPAEALPTSLFGFFARLQEAVPQVARWKYSACLEGAQRAYAHMKTHYPRVEAAVVATGPPEGKTQTVEQYLAPVMEGARITEAECPKDTMYF